MARSDISYGGFDGHKAEPRADEVDYLPITNEYGETYHLFMNDEDFCTSKEDKLRLRREKKRNKRKDRYS